MRAVDATSDPDRTVPELPALSPGVQLLSADCRATGAIGSLAVDHALREGGPVYWIDAAGHARTGPLARLAPSRRTLDRIRIARGFTAYQHYSLVETLRDRGPAADPTLAVCPAIDAPYRADDLRGDEGRELLVRAIAALAGLARRHDLPVLVTRERADGFADPVANATDRTIRYEDTDLGPRFVGEAFDTAVYPMGDGTVQTTFAFWERVLRARAAEHDPAALADLRGSGESGGSTAGSGRPTPATSEVIADGTH